MAEKEIKFFNIPKNKPKSVDIIMFDMETKKSILWSAPRFIAKKMVNKIDCPGFEICPICEMLSIEERKLEFNESKKGFWTNETMED